MEGYLCHISCEAVLDASPQQVFAILTNEDNTAVFRDVKAMGYRKVLEHSEGLRVIEVEQCGEIKILFKRHMFSTFLTVTEDCRNPELLTTTFSLIRSDVLAKFQGTWQLSAMHSESAPRSRTHVRLEQDVSPVGVPDFMKKVPVVGNVLKKICKRAVHRVLEDVQAIIAELNRGTTLENILQHTQLREDPETRLDSHAVIDFSDSDDEDV